MKSKTKIIYTIILNTAVLVPQIVFAAKSFKDYVYQDVLPIIEQATQLLVAVAVIILMYQAMTVTWGEANAQEKKNFASRMAWGILIIFVMVSIWGIIAILRNTLERGSI